MFCYKENHFYASTTKYFLLYACVTWMYNLGPLLRVKSLIFSIVLYLHITPCLNHTICSCSYKFCNWKREGGNLTENSLPDGENWNITLVSLPAQIHFDKLEMIYGEKTIFTLAEMLLIAIQCSHFLHCFVYDYSLGLNTQSKYVAFLACWLLYDRQTYNTWCML